MLRFNLTCNLQLFHREAAVLERRGYLYQSSFLFFFFLDDSQSVDRPKTHDDSTLVSNVPSSPSTSPKVAGTHGIEIKHVHVKLKLIEEVNILKDDTEGKRSIVSALTFFSRNLNV